MMNLTGTSTVKLRVNKPLGMICFLVHLLQLWSVTIVFAVFSPLNVHWHSQFPFKQSSQSNQSNSVNSYFSFSVFSLLICTSMYFTFCQQSFCSYRAVCFILQYLFYTFDFYYVFPFSKAALFTSKHFFLSEKETAWQLFVDVIWCVGRSLWSLFKFGCWGNSFFPFVTKMYQFLAQKLEIWSVVLSY